MKSLRRSSLWLIVIATFALSALASAQADTKDADAARAQALNIFTLFKARDWKGLYDVIQLSPEVAKTIPSRDDFAVGFAKGLKDSDPNDDFSKLVDTMDDVIAGTAIIENGNAYVATSCTVTVDSAKV